MLRGSSSKPPLMPAGKGIDSHVKNLHFNDALFGNYKTSALIAKAIWDKIKAGSIPTLLVSKWDGTKPLVFGFAHQGDVQCKLPLPV